MWSIDGFRVDSPFKERSGCINCQAACISPLCVACLKNLARLCDHVLVGLCNIPTRMIHHEPIENAEIGDPGGRGVHIVDPAIATDEVTLFNVPGLIVNGATGNIEH